MFHQTETIREIVIEESSILLTAKRNALGVDVKTGAANFATHYDREMQRRLISALHELLPEAYFLAEESDPENLGHAVPVTCLERMVFADSEAARTAEWLFVIDPIDGTSNFMKDLHHSCVSVALFHKGEAHYGIVYQPWTREIYEYREGVAYLNDEHLDQREAGGLATGLVAFGTSPYKPEIEGDFWQKLIAVFQRCIDLRREGSAALDICGVASGKYVLFFEDGLQPWDYAAAQMIAEAAGCLVRTLDNKPITELSPTSIIVGTEEATADFFDLERVPVQRQWGGVGGKDHD